ncbi:MAG: hypothetical protein ACE14P_15725 [Methanotrichaceae archaeon]
MAKIMLPLLLLAAIVLPASAEDLGFGTPSIQITSPGDNTTVPAGNVTITVHVDDFTVEDNFGAANVDGQGHIHYFKDVAVPTTPGKIAVTANDTWVMSANTSYTWPNIAAGMHRFATELVNNDHTPLNPPKYAMVNVTAT